MTAYRPDRGAHADRVVLACRLACSSLLPFAVMVSPPAWGTVVSAGDGGFVVREEALFAGPPDAAWQRLVRVQDWWNSEHTWSGDAGNLSLELKPGACWCERLPDGGFVRHMEVVFVKPGAMLRLAGGLGPLQGMGVSGALTFTLKADTEHPGSTRVVAEYRVSGYAPEGFTKLAGAVDGVLGEQVTRLGKAP